LGVLSQVFFKTIFSWVKKKFFFFLPKKLFGVLKCFFGVFPFPVVWGGNLVPLFFFFFSRGWEGREIIGRGGGLVCKKKTWGGKKKFGGGRFSKGPPFKFFGVHRGENFLKPQLWARCFASFKKTKTIPPSRGGQKTVTVFQFLFLFGAYF